MEESKFIGIQLKEQGNTFFRQKKFADAIQCYSEAIRLDQQNPQFYLNRAKCHKELKDFQACLEDAQKAIQLDPAYIKGHAVCGEALVELGKSEVGSYSKIDQGVKALQKAFALCMG